MVKLTPAKIGKRTLFYLLVLIIVLPIMFPLYFVVISSLKDMAQIYRVPPVLFGFTPILDHYKYIFEYQNFGHNFYNSSIIAIVSTLVAMVLGVPAAYSISRYKMQNVSTAILIARLLPSISFLLPYYYIFSKMKLIDSYFVMVISHMVLSLPLIVWIMTGFIAEIPYDLEEAAIVDGCTKQSCFSKIILPISGPGLVTCATLSFLGSWNNFQFALILGGDKVRTLPVSLQYFVSGSEIRWGRMLAATVVVIIPTIILTMILQKYIVKGLTAGAVKG